MLIGLVLTPLINLPAFAPLTEAGCRLPKQEVKGFFQDGDIVLGAVLSVHWTHSNPELSFTKEPKPPSCVNFQVRSYRDVLAIAFAVEEINKNLTLLPNITLGFHLHDSCLSEAFSLASTMSFLSGGMEPLANYQCSPKYRLLGVVGEVSGPITSLMATLLGVYRVPQISYGTTLTTLSNKILFPSFLRTVPSDLMGVYAIASLLQYFGWTWVGIIAADDLTGVLGSELLKEEIEKTGGCVAFLEKVSPQYTKDRVKNLVDFIKRSTANVTVIYNHVSFMVPLLEMAAQEKCIGKVWVGSTIFRITPDLFTTETWKSLNGTITFAFHFAKMSGFKEFVHNIHPTWHTNDIFIKTFWEKVFGCKCQGTNSNWGQGDGGGNGTNVCTGKEKVASLQPFLFDFENLRYTYSTYIAVYAFAHAMHNIISCKSWSKGILDSSCVDIEKLQPYQILRYVRKVHFATSSGEEVFFDKNGDPPAVYDILNWHILPNGTYTLSTVGNFDSHAAQGHEITINTDAIIWNSLYSEVPISVCSASCLPGFRKAAREGQAKCCYDCVPCDMGEISNETDAATCIKCREDQWSNEKRDTCVASTIEFLSLEEPLGAVLSALSGLLSFLTVSIFFIFVKYKNTPIVKANNRTLSYLLLISLSLCFLCSFLFIGYPLKWTCMFRQMAFGLIFSFSIACILGKTVMVTVAFRATKPNSRIKKWVGSRTPTYLVLFCTAVQLVLCTVWLATDPPYSGISTTTPMKIIVQCYEGSILMYYCMLGYLGFLAGASFIVAFLSRNLPDSFNEAKYITFSLLVFLSVWLSFIPAYLSTQGKYMVAVEVFAILASSSGLLSCIFFHKLYIILLRPDMNTKNYLLGRMPKQHPL